MKKIIFVGLIILLSLSACVPDFLNPNSDAAPAEAVDIAATVDAASNTKVAQTFEALNTPTLEAATAEPVMEEATATDAPTEELPPTETATLEVTETHEGIDLAGTETTAPEGTLPAETTTEAPEETLVPATGTPEVTATSVYPSPTSPIYANQVPDYIPKFKIDVRNNTNVRVYISLQGVTEGGYKPIIEYDLAPWQKVKLTVPEGRYAVVVYVGKDPMIEYVGIHSSNTVEIIIEKDRVKIR